MAVGEALAAAGEGAAPTQGRAAVHHGKLLFVKCVDAELFNQGGCAT